MSSIPSRKLLPGVVSITICGLLVVNILLFMGTVPTGDSPSIQYLRDKLAGTVFDSQQSVVSGGSGAWAATCDRCMVNPELCGKFGSHNVDLSRAFEGTGGRVQKVLKRAMEGEPIKIGAIGGSITRGHGCKCRPWGTQIGDWWNATFPHEDNVYESGAIGARGSNYYQFCHHQHLPQDADLILVEMSVNDIMMTADAFETFETLLRALLTYPKHPAVIVLQTFQIQQQSATGGDAHLSTCGYYDVPVINIRNWMLPKFMADYSAADQWFIWQEGKDKLHPLGEGHQAMAEMVELYLEQQICFIRNERPYLPPSDISLVPQTNQFANIDSIPRVRLSQKLEADNSFPDIKSSCASVDSVDMPLVPNQAGTNGWEYWEQPPQMEKKYWRSTVAGSVITFDMTVASGRITLYYLRSPKMDLGAVQCWLDNDKSKMEILNGYWDRDASIGESKELKFGGQIAPGEHQLHCENIGSADKEHAERTTFLVIGLFTV